MWRSPAGPRTGGGRGCSEAAEGNEINETLILNEMRKLEKRTVNMYTELFSQTNTLTLFHSNQDPYSHVV